MLQFLALEPALIRAVFSGDPAEVRSALDEGGEAGDINYVDADKRSALHAAAFHGDAEIMEILISEAGGRVNTKDNKWLTPLHRACAARVSRESIKWLQFKGFWSVIISLLHFRHPQLWRSF